MVDKTNYGKANYDTTNRKLPSLHMQATAGKTILVILTAAALLVSGCIQAEFIGRATGGYYVANPTDRIVFNSMSYETRVKDPASWVMEIRFPNGLTVTPVDCDRIGGMMISALPGQPETLCDVYYAVKAKRPKIYDSNGNTWGYAKFYDFKKEVVIERGTYETFYGNMGPSEITFDFGTTPPEEPEPPGPECTWAGDCEGRVHPLCLGEWRCISAECVWECYAEGPGPVPTPPPQPKTVLELIIGWFNDILAWFTNLFQGGHT